MTGHLLFYERESVYFFFFVPLKFPILFLQKELVLSWLVGCFGFNGPLRQYFSLYRTVSQREGERGEKRTDESKNVQTTPTRTYYKRSRPLPFCHLNCRTPQHWKFTQHHRTTRPPLSCIETSFVVPVTILAASFCILSSSAFSYCVQLSQTTLAYSKRGLIKVKKNISSDFLSISNLSLRIIFILFQAFSLTKSICLCHVQSLER